ncbi:hypothetical protein EDD15DRAFT_2269524, partial [Pisolithus albus]
MGRGRVGKLFAVAEIKMVLLIVIKNFVLEMRDGPDTKVEMTRRIKMRPKVPGKMESRYHQELGHTRV